MWKGSRGRNLFSCFAPFTSSFVVWRNSCILSKFWTKREFNSSSLCPASQVVSQPLADTHPHLMKPGELTPGITRVEYRERRTRLMSLIAQSHNGMIHPHHVVIIPSSTTNYMSQDVPYTFRQNSDFLYLTGCQEPDTLLLLESVPGHSLPEHRAVLFVQPQDPHWETWNGPRCSVDEAVNIFGMDEGREVCDLPLYLRRFHWTPHCIWYDCLNPAHADYHTSISVNLINSNESTAKSIRPVVPEIHKLRVIKSEPEIQVMRKSAKIAAESFREVLRYGQRGMTELEIGAKMEYECKKRGAERMAYPPVVGAGNRATILHYLVNSHVANDGDLVLMDAGCEYHGYASDITRTWPINGKFTDVQRQLYDAVHRVQRACIELVRPGTTLNEIHKVAETLVGSELEKLDLIKKSVFASIQKRAIDLMVPHHIGHYLGLDTHDTPTITRDTPLQPGMVITIEPGVYCPQHITHIPTKYKGIGIRIEDDVLVTETGCEVLTTDIPTDANLIESLGST